MYSVVIIKRLDEALPASINDLPARGEVINSAAALFHQDFFKSMKYDDAIEMARGYNTKELENKPENGTWAIVLAADLPITPGALIQLENAHQLN